MDAFNQYLGRPDSAEIPSNAVLQALIRRYPWFTTARIVQSRISGKIDPELALRLTVRPVPDILLRSVGLSTVVDNTPCGTTYSSLETMSKREKLENAELQTDVSNVADQHEVAVNDTATLITESEALPVESVIAVAKISVLDGLKWIGQTGLMSVQSLFPPPYYDTGYASVLNEYRNQESYINFIKQFGSIQNISY